VGEIPTQEVLERRCIRSFAEGGRLGSSSNLRRCKSIAVLREQEAEQQNHSSNMELVQQQVVVRMA
jgi:hypothetical protein